MKFEEAYKQVRQADLALVSAADFQAFWEHYFPGNETTCTIEQAEKAFRNMYDNVCTLMDEALDREREGRFSKRSKEDIEMTNKVIAEALHKKARHIEAVLTEKQRFDADAKGLCGLVTSLVESHECRVCGLPGHRVAACWFNKSMTHCSKYDQHRSAAVDKYKIRIVEDNKIDLINQKAEFQLKEKLMLIEHRMVMKMKLRAVKAKYRKDY